MESFWIYACHVLTWVTIWVRWAARADSWGNIPLLQANLTATADIKRGGETKVKNYQKEGQQLPLFGIGPGLVSAMAFLIIIGVILSCTALKEWNCGGAGIWAFRIVGALLMIGGFMLWYIGALRSGMDENITDNKLKTDGIYAWVRNPMYSGWGMFMVGVSFLWHNYCLLIAPALCWGLMTVVLENTEEKWLLKTYGTEYQNYCKRVNRCIPWFPRKWL